MSYLMLFQQGYVKKITKNYDKSIISPGGPKTNRKAQEHPIFAPLLMSDLLID